LIGSTGMWFSRPFKNLARQMRDYETLTRSRYRDTEVAERYKRAYTNRLGISNFRAKIIASREVSVVRRMLGKCYPLSNMAVILDFPCGTGKMGNILAKRFNVVAADISAEMLHLARNDYQHQESARSFYGFVQADLTMCPFSGQAFDCVVTIRLMHRVPPDIRIEMLRELARISKQHVIVSYAITNLWHRMRSRIRTLAIHGESAPYSATIQAIREEIYSSGLEIITCESVVPFLSAEIILLLRKSSR
jgi:ubiquinone/menaquinone biosynthesis C-methylase UbiE